MGKRPKARTSTPGNRARALVLELARVTDGQSMRWYSLSEVAERAEADAEAVYYAVQKDWVEVAPNRDPHSIRLLEEGRQVASQGQRTRKTIIGKAKP